MVFKIYSKSISHSMYNVVKNLLYNIGSRLFILANKNKIWFLKNRYCGKRCFIIGNGPSLKKTDLSKLKDEYTFGLNRIYLNFNNMGYETSFLVCVNQLLINQCYLDFEKLNKPIKFFPIVAHNMRLGPRVIYVESANEEHFSEDISDHIWEGATVTFVALQIAYYLGFSEVYLIGVDHNFISLGTPHEVLRMNGNDPNHFDPNYFKGLKWQYPDLITSEKAYSMAKSTFESSGRKIYDATIGGKLKVFEKVKYSSLWRS